MHSSDCGYCSNNVEFQQKKKHIIFMLNGKLITFFTQVKDKCVCLLCKASVAEKKKRQTSLQNRSLQYRKGFPSEFLLKEREDNTTKIAVIYSTIYFFKKLGSNKAATEASFHISTIIAQNRKPYEDGELIKDAFLGAADTLFNNFENKGDIMFAIQSVQLSAHTIMRSVESISSDVVSQLKTDLDCCSYFSLQLDESTDTVDTAQLAIFITMVFDDFQVKEELVKVVPFQGHTTEHDIYSAFKKLIDSENISVQKLEDLATDEAPAMVGGEKEFIEL